MTALRKPVLSWLLLLCCLLTPIAHATITLNADTRHINLTRQMEVIEDARQSLTLNDILNNPDLPWLAISTEVFSAGLNQSAFWFRITLQQDDDSQRERLLEIANPLLDAVDVHFLHNGRILEEISVGDALPFAQRPLPHRNFLLPLPQMSQGDTLVILIRATTSGSMVMPLHVYEHEVFIEKEQGALAWQYVFYGVLLAMAIVNLLVYLATRNISYFFYVGTMVSLLLFQTALHGFGFQLLWPENQWWQERAIAFSISSSGTFAVLFAISFLRLRQQKRMYYYPFAALVVLGVSCTLLSLILPYALSLRLAIAGIVSGVPLCIIIGALLLRQGFVPARFYLLAWSCLMLSSFILIGSRTGLLPINMFTDNIQQIGATLQAVLLTVALADQIQQMHREQLTAQSAALHHERELREARERANLELEKRVAERTRELAEANARLAKMSIIDELSTLHNRRYFNQKFEADFKAAYREQQSIAVLMIDIDHFKQINDRYGHLAGDRCIAHVASLIRKSVTRASDTVARYGGEEFVVVLCNTGTEGAWHVGEEIRTRIAQTPLLWHKQTITFTVSCGIAATVPPHYSAMLPLLNRADTALYRAKQEGRNRICIDTDPAMESKSAPT